MGLFKDLSVNSGWDGLDLFVKSKYNSATSSYDIATEKVTLTELKSELLNNLYSNDGNLTGDRIITMNTHDLTFSGGDVGIGTSPIGAKLHIRGVDDLSGNYALKVNSLSNELFTVRNDGFVGIGTSTQATTEKFRVVGNVLFDDNILMENNGITLTVSNGLGDRVQVGSWNGTSAGIGSTTATPFALRYFGVDNILLTSALTTIKTTTTRIDGNLGVGTAPLSKLHVAGNQIIDAITGTGLTINGVDDLSGNYALKVNSLSNELFNVRNDGRLNMTNYLSLNGNKILHSTADASNIMLGQNAGQVCTGIRNIMLGYTVGNLISSGSYNVGVGFNLFGSLTSSTQNMAVGGSVFNVMTSGTENVVAGMDAFKTMTGGSQNTGLGKFSGKNFTSGVQNTFIGYNTGTTTLVTAVNSSIALGSGSQVNGSNQFVLGSPNGYINDLYFGHGIESNVISGTEVNFKLTALTGTDEDNDYSLILNAGQGTGTGFGGYIGFKVSPPTTTGSTTNPLVETFTINNDKSVTFKPITGVEATALTTELGKMVVVSSTDGVFTSVGAWLYDGTNWVKL